MFLTKIGPVIIFRIKHQKIITFAKNIVVNDEKVFRAFDFISIGDNAESSVCRAAARYDCRDAPWCVSTFVLSKIIAYMLEIL